LILFAEQIISETVRKEKAEELFALKIQDAKGEDYTEDFQKKFKEYKAKFKDKNQKHKNKTRTKKERTTIFSHP